MASLARQSYDASTELSEPVSPLKFGKAATSMVRHVSSPAAAETRHEQLRRILGACENVQELVQGRLPVTEREVSKLRKAFQLATGGDATLRDDAEEDSADACDRALAQLEEYVRTRPEAQTFDVVEDNGAKTCWWRFLGIPLERRLQTLVVSMFLFFTFVPLSLALTVMLLLNAWTFPPMLVYLVYIFTLGQPRHPLRKNATFTQLRVWRHYSDYFPVRLVIPKHVQRQFDPCKNYFFVYHPHGIHGFGAIAKFTLDATLRSLLPGVNIHVQTLKLNLFFPFWRELLFLGGCGDASAECIRRTLRAGPGESVLLVVGGAKESLLARPNTNELTLRNRKGFVKIALQEGTPLVPVYAFGENDVYRIPRVARSRWWKRLESFLRRRTLFAFPLFLGRGWFNYCFGVLPHRRPIVVVVGPPMPVPKIPSPTPQDVQTWHAKYVAALQQLFDENCGVYGMGSGGLRIL